MIKYFLLVLSIGYCTAPVNAQQTPATAGKQADYTRMITDRAHKIVAALGLSDSATFYRVRSMVAGQYSNLNDIYNDRDQQVRAVKAASASKDSVSAAVERIQESIDPRLHALHDRYITSLSKALTPEQVTKIKDGMTYGVLPITYKGYQAMLPNLTDTQKKQVLDWLTEAREHAMDAESSEKKHAWFGKYKGRINNYLSAQGYNMKQASEDWAKRVKEEAGAAGKH